LDQEALKWRLFSLEMRNERRRTLAGKCESTRIAVPKLGGGGESIGIVKDAQPGLAVPQGFFSNLLDLTAGLLTASNT
jgi:hypothetical protein